MARTSFKRMEDATAADWRQVQKEANRMQSGMADTVLAMLRECDRLHQNFAVSQLQHMLQTATRARKANASDDMVLAALCHDVGKVISILNHDRVAAELLKPFVSEPVYHVVRTHQDFQSRYWAPHFGTRAVDTDRYRSEPWYDQAITFSVEWDQVAFDASLPPLKLEAFEPLVRARLGRFDL